MIKLGEQTTFFYFFFPLSWGHWHDTYGSIVMQKDLVQIDVC